MDTQCSSCWRLTEDQRRLAESEMPLALAMSRLATRRYPHLRDDLRSNACLGLCEAAHVFQPARNVPFGAFARVIIQHRMFDAILRSVPLGFRRNNHRKITDLPAIITLNGVPLCCLPLSRDPDIQEAVADRDLVERAMDILPFKERTAMHCLAHGEPFRTVAKVLGLSTRRVFHLRDRALHKLRLWNDAEGSEEMSAVIYAIRAAGGRRC